MTQKSFEDRATDVLDATFRGLHHLPFKIKKDPNCKVWEMSCFSDQLATFDFDLLTRLVISAHDNCIRVSILSSGPKLIKIRLFNREGREGFMSVRHPTMEEALKNFRENHPL